MALRDLFRVKPMDRLLRETEREELRLKQTLGPVQLTSLGIGAIVGAGIFSTVGTAAAGGAAHVGAGPALVISFLLVAVACGFAALCYAEFAADGAGVRFGLHLRLRDAGGVGRLDHRVGPDPRIRRWQRGGGHLLVRPTSRNCLRGVGLDLPAWLGTDYRSALQAARQVAEAQAAQSDAGLLGATVLRDAAALAEAPQLFGLPIIFNLPAFLIVALITWVLVLGIRESARFNTALVVLKLVVIAFFLVLGAFYVKPENWTPFAPNGLCGHFQRGGDHLLCLHRVRRGLHRGGGDAATRSGTCRIGILASLIVCTVIYVAVALVLTGLVQWDKLGTAEPLAAVFCRAWA